LRPIAAISPDSSFCHADTVTVLPASAFVPRVSVAVAGTEAYLVLYSAKCVFCHAST